MKASLVIALVLATSTPGHRLFLQPNLSRGGPPEFELAPADGAGLGAACACPATVTGSKGEAITWTRASTQTCISSADFTSIAVGDAATCDADEPAVMPGGDGSTSLGLLIESGVTKPLLRSDELDDAAWSDVGTPTVVANAALSPFNALTAETIEDDSGAAKEGREQTYAVGGNGTFNFNCFVGGGTATEASLTIASVGGSGSTTCNATGLSATTYKWVDCSVTTSGSTTGISNTVFVGDAVGDTGTIRVAGCNGEPFGYKTSYVATAGSSVARAATTNAIGTSLPMVPSSVAVSVVGVATASARQFVVTVNSTYRRLWDIGGNVAADRDSPTLSSTGAAVLDSARFAGRFAGQGAGASVQACQNGTCVAATTGDSTTATAGTSTNVGYNALNGYYIQGVLKQLCIDSNPERCL